jgi:hypothetical protein
MTMINKLVQRNDLVRLKELSQHDIHNAFHDLRFGLQNDRGIHGSCPMEMLHALLLGIFKCTRDALFIQVGKTSASAEELNSLSKLCGAFFQHQSDRDVPKTNFTNGISKGKLMAKECTGVLLVMAAILRCSLGRHVLQSARSRNLREDYQIRDWVMMVETLLEWEAFLKSDVMQKDHVIRLKKKNRCVMYLVKKVMDRSEGMGMKIVKFHGIIHYAEDILMFGVPNVVDTGSNESHHKETKASAKTTQKDIKAFEKQVAMREDELHMLDLATEEIDGRPLWEYFDGYFHYDGADDDDAAPAADAPITGGAAIKVHVDEDGDNCWHIPRQRKKRKVKDLDSDDDDNDDAYDGTFQPDWEVGVVDFLVNLQNQLRPYTNQLEIRCEHKRKGAIFRAHPNYRQRGYWNDWVLVDWGADGKLPCELWCFIDLRDALPDGVRVELAGCIIQNGVCAVVESSSYLEDEDEINRSDLFVPIEKEVETLNEEGAVSKRRFYLADVEAFVEPITVVPNVGSSNKCMYFQVLSRKKWKDRFIDWLAEPHSLDEIEEESSDEEE